MTIIEKEKHESELTKRLISRLKTGITMKEALEKLSVQELIAVWKKAEEALSSEAPTNQEKENLQTGVKMITNMIPVRISSQSIVYTAMRNYVKMPMFLRNGSICLFSEKTYADAFRDKCMEKFISFQVTKIEKADLYHFLYQASFMYGAKGIVIDPGQNTTTYPPSWFLSSARKRDNEITNPSLVRSLAMLQQETEFIREYERKKDFVSSLQAQSIKHLVNAKFIIPAKKNRNSLSYPAVAKPGTKLPLFTPIFTDKEQYSMFYGSTGYYEEIYSFTDLKKVNTDNFVINPGTLWFPLEKELVSNLVSKLSKKNR